MEADAPIVKFTSLQKRYGDGPLVLRDIDLAVQPGDFVTLIGPSGCGKSTVLKLVSGLSPGTEGKVSVLGTTPRQARDRQAFIFQDATLLPWLTTQLNAELPLRLRGTAPAERTAKAREMLDLVGLGTARDYYPRQLSGGMKMRVSIARAMDTRIFMPFTAMFVTHSVAEAVFLSNRILVMAANPGRFHAEVRVEFAYPRRPELREQPGFQAKVNEVSRLLHEVEVPA